MHVRERYSTCDDLYARKTVSGDKHVDIPLDAAEKPSLPLAGMTAAELREHIDSLHKLLTQPSEVRLIWQNYLDSIRRRMSHHLWRTQMMKAMT